MGKAYEVAGQADAYLHKIGILQAYKAGLFRDLDEGKGVETDMVKELCRATDLSLPATKETARAIGHSMTAMVATERHLWLNLSGIKEKDKSFLLDTSSVTQSTLSLRGSRRPKSRQRHSRGYPLPGSGPRGCCQSAVQAIDKLLKPPAAERECRISRLPQRDWGSRRHSRGKTDLRTFILGKKALGKRS